MGPRSDERGNAASCGETPRFHASLQWGRAPMSAEIPAPERWNWPQRRGFNGAALR